MSEEINKDSIEEEEKDPKSEIVEKIEKAISENLDIDDEEYELEESEETKKNSNVNIAKIIVMILAVICFLYSGGYLLTNLVIVPYLNQKSYEDIKNLGNTGEETKTADSAGVWTDSQNQEVEDDVDRDENGIIMTLSEAAKQYPDLKGWIEVPGTRINYPIVQSPDPDDNEYYLYRGIDGKDNKNGTIFFDIRNDISSIDSQNKNLLIYGHHMKSGEMFADLMKYSSVDFYKQSPVIRMDTIYEPGMWVVISVMKCNTLKSHGEPFYYAKTDFADDAEFEKFIADVKARSMIDTPYTATAADELMTLQTCSYEYKDFRTVIVARKLRSDEAEIDVSTAMKAENPIMPDVWNR